MIATLSLTMVIGGVAVSAYAGMQMRITSVEQGRDYLPAAQIQWDSETSTVTQPMTKVGTFLGTISIPSIKKTVNIFEGTESVELSKGVGHYLKSVMPGVVDNSVLAGHRDTVFSNLGKVKIGAPVVITTRDGVFTYHVDRIRIVDKNDKTVIVPTKVATLTLSTCYPFAFIGSAPKRYIVIATL